MGLFPPMRFAASSLAPLVLFCLALIFPLSLASPGLFSLSENDINIFLRTRPDFPVRKTNSCSSFLSIFNSKGLFSRVDHGFSTVLLPYPMKTHVVSGLSNVVCEFSPPLIRSVSDLFELAPPPSPPLHFFSSRS